jgi:hypothetical protein
MAFGASLGSCMMIDLLCQRKASMTWVIIFRTFVWAAGPLVFALSLCGDDHVFDTPFAFGSPILAMGLIIYLTLYREWIPWESIGDRTKQRLKCYVVYGVLTSMVGVGCEAFQELLCDKTVVARFFPGHALWHLLCPFGLNAMLIYLCALWAEVRHQRMVFVEYDRSKSCLYACWYTCLPIFEMWSVAEESSCGISADAVSKQ